MRCTARASYSADMTRELPDGQSLLIRTDFSDDARWSDTVEAATQPTDEGFLAGLTVVDDAEFDRLTLGELAVIIGSPPPYYVFLAGNHRRDRVFRIGDRRSVAATSFRTASAAAATSL